MGTARLPHPRPTSCLQPESLKNTEREQDAFLHVHLNDNNDLLRRNEFEEQESCSTGSDLDDLYFKSFCMSDGDRCRMGREFFSPAPISLTGNYWPRYRNCDKSVPQTGSAFVTYLAL